MDGIIKQTALDLHAKGIGIQYNEIVSLFTSKEAIQFLNILKNLQLNTAAAIVHPWIESPEGEIYHSAEWWYVKIPFSTPNYAQASYTRAIEVIEEMDQELVINQYYIEFEDEQTQRLRVTLESILSGSENEYPKDWELLEIPPIETLFLGISEYPEYSPVNIAGIEQTLPLCLAIGIDKDGKPHILRFEVQEEIATDFWQGFLGRLKENGLKNIKLAVSNNYDELQKALAQFYPDTLLQWNSSSDKYINHNFRKIRIWQREIQTFPSMDVYKQVLIAILKSEAENDPTNN